MTTFINSRGHLHHHLGLDQKIRLPPFRGRGFMVYNRDHPLALDDPHPFDGWWSLCQNHH